MPNSNIEQIKIGTQYYPVGSEAPHLYKHTFHFDLEIDGNTLRIAYARFNTISTPYTVETIGTSGFDIVAWIDNDIPFIPGPYWSFDKNDMVYYAQEFVGGVWIDGDDRQASSFSDTVTQIF